MLRLDEMSLIESLLWSMLTYDYFFLLLFLMKHDFAASFVDRAAGYLRFLSGAPNPLPSFEDAVLFFVDFSFRFLLKLLSTILNRK